MNLREAAEMALEALDCIYSPLHVREINKVGKAMAALRQALATQDTMQDTMQVTTQVTTQMAKRKTLVELLDSTPDDAVNMSKECVDETDKREQEPWPSVQCVCGGTIYFKYTPREWVGLTEDEKQFFKAMGFSGIDIVEAKLKEKNHG